MPKEKKEEVPPCAYVQVVRADLSNLQESYQEQQKKLNGNLQKIWTRLDWYLITLVGALVLLVVNLLLQVWRLPK